MNIFFPIIIKTLGDNFENLQEGKNKNLKTSQLIGWVIT